MRFSYGILTGVLMLMGVMRYGIANEILINTYDGKAFVFDIDPEESLGSLEEKICALLDEKPETILIDFQSNHAIWTGSAAIQRQGGFIGHPRDYYIDVSHEEKSHIRFIVTLLANKSLISIALSKADLEQAGDKIDHVHPLRFLMTIFSDEEMKVGIRNIRNKGWVWSQFAAGIKQSLSTETSLENIKEDQVRHFATTLEIKFETIYPSLKNHRWDEFIDLLIKHVPRKGNHDRYDF